MSNLYTKNNVFSVSQLNANVHLLLQEAFPAVLIEGELSNIARPSSGHLYFTLKDNKAQIRCAMFRMQNRRLNFNPSDGTQVLVKAKVSLYQPRGDYQLIIEHMEETGDGALRKAYEVLKNKLHTEGLFDQDHKQDIPELPNTIGVISSASGAAIHDIISVLKRRFAGIPIIIYPTAVQGKTAAPNIVNAIKKANRRKECDVLILARGGGSLEDLWCFNDETVARAIYHSKLPMVTGIGHEIDTTIADYVADWRAATPSAAAEVCSPDMQDWLHHINLLVQQLQQHSLRHIQQLKQKLQWLLKRLQHPGQRLQTQAQQVDRLEQSLLLAFDNLIHRKQTQLHTLQLHLQRLAPTRYIQQQQDFVLSLQQQLYYTIHNNLQQSQHRLQQAALSLDTMSPLATLSRGYSILQDSDGKIVNNIQQVNIGDKVSAKIHHGELLCTVDGLTGQCT